MRGAVWNEGRSLGIGGRPRLEGRGGASSAITAHISATAGGRTAVCTVTVAAPATPETATPESAATPETAATPESASTPETATPETAAAAGQPAPTLSGFLRRFLGLGGRQEDYLIPWCKICRIGPDIILVDADPEKCRIPRMGKPKSCERP